MLRAYSKSEGPSKRHGRDRGADADLRHPPSDPSSVAADYATHVLASLGHTAPATISLPDRHPALVAAATGLTELTGCPDGPPSPSPGHLAACARGSIAALEALTGNRQSIALDGATVLGERAAIFGLTRGGTTSAGGRCRLIRARDGWIAVNLPRPEDLATIPAWLETDASGDPWHTVAAIAADRTAGPLVARARLLGLAVAEAAPPAATAPPWFRVAGRGPRARSGGGWADVVGPDADASGSRFVSLRDRPPLVVDLSTLWAGPLASHLLQLAGARVVKVESPSRPDGTRRGPAAFFDLLHAGKESVALDFANPLGRKALVALVARADIVIESARPRALNQLGIDPAVLVRARPGLTWISITGYGRRGAASKWIGFGDDTAAAAGFATATGVLAASDTPLFCGDAIADPLAGMHAATAALGAYRHGGGLLVSLALRDVAAHTLAFGPNVTAAAVRALYGDDGARTWHVLADGEQQAVLRPEARTPLGAARALGADTDSVLRALHVR
jgi:CoA-transferase family III